MAKRWTIAGAGCGLLLMVACPKNTPEGAPPADEERAQRPLVTSSECRANGGTIVADIGDGAINRPDFLCDSGEPPLGTITAEQGEPVAVEGAVCCASPPALEPERPLVTSLECQAQGGTIVGDIGDGAVHHPDYRCSNGQLPLGTLTAEPGEQGEPVPVEGAVCCGS